MSIYFNCKMVRKSTFNDAKKTTWKHTRDLNLQVCFFSLTYTADLCSGVYQPVLWNKANWL